MSHFEDDQDLALQLKESIEDGGISEADLSPIFRRILGDDLVNFYPSTQKGACTANAIFFADIKVNHVKLSFDDAIDAMIEHVCGKCPEVRRVVFLCFGEFSLKKYKIFQSTIEMQRRLRGISIEFYQWIPNRLAKLPH